jgi:hypothetical protein
MKRMRVQASRAELETDSGEVAERMASVEYGYNASRSGSYYDAERDSGAKIEVKSTFRMIGREYPEKGRFRIPEPQHKKLLRRDRTGSTFYVFVLFNSNTQEKLPQDAFLKRVSPSDLGNLIGSMGGFENSGHNSFDREKKIIWTAIFDSIS